MSHPLFQDRHAAGRALAHLLAWYTDWPDTLVLALPRGGVPVGFEVAKALQLPLDVFVVRKLGVPDNEEYAMGAIASGGIQVLNEKMIQLMEIDRADVEQEIAAEQRELQRREALYRPRRPPLDIAGRTVLLVDDGLATGATMTAAIKALRAMHPARIVVAVPVAASDTCRELHQEADRVICAATPEPFRAVGLWYRDFEQTTDDEVRSLLERAEHSLGQHA